MSDENIDRKLHELMCTVSDCENPQLARGWCHKHYQRWYRNNKGGDPSSRRTTRPVQYVRDPLIQERNFWKKVARTDPNDCWPWTGKKSSSGYGRFRMDGQTQTASRVALFYATGRMPKNCVLHSCDNPPCVNPKHLREGSHKDNAKDRGERNRTARGDKIPSSVLTEARVLIIKERLTRGDKVGVIARDEGVDSSTISNIRRGRTWKHITI